MMIMITLLFSIKIVCILATDKNKEDGVVFVKKTPQHQRDRFKVEAKT